MKKECKDVFEAFWEAIRVKRLIKRYCLRKAKMQEERSMLPVVEPLMENASDESEENEPKSPHSDSVDQVVKVEQEETNNEENIKESNHLMDPIASPPI